MIIIDSKPIKETKKYGYDDNSKIFTEKGCFYMWESYAQIFLIECVVLHCMG